METNRLIIRNFLEEDAISCFNHFGQDKKIGRYILFYPMKSIEEMKTLIKSFVQNSDAWVVICKETSEPMGYVTIEIPYSQLGIGEIGYALGENYHNKGYAYEAVSCILEEYFLKRNMYMIEAKYNETNLASERLLNKLGFSVDGKLRDRRIDLVTGERNSLVVSSITKEEFETKILG